MKTTYEVIDEPMTGKVIKRINADGSESFIPFDESNSDYQRYLRWLENPNEVEHLTEIPTPPAE